MIVKMNNKDKNFYNVMGKIFGSRIVQNETNDRMYDDDNKIWYVDLDNDKVLSFASVSNNVIKNVYSSKESSFIKVLQKIKNDMKVESSVVTNVYEDLYKKAEYKVKKTDDYKNFLYIEGK